MYVVPVTYSLKATALRLDMGVKTLTALCDAGEMRYIAGGIGEKNKRRRFTDEIIAEFLERRTRRDVKPCQSIPTKTVRSITSISNTGVIGFMAAREKRINEKLKR